MTANPIFRPRRSRSVERGKLAQERVRLAGGDITAQFDARIAEEFGTRSIIDGIKLCAERYIRMSFGHPETRARYAPWIKSIVDRSLSLDGACDWLAAERRATDNLRFTRERKIELHIILRWLRFTDQSRAFAEMVDAANAPVRVLEAAE